MSLSNVPHFACRYVRNGYFLVFNIGSFRHGGRFPFWSHCYCSTYTYLCTLCAIPITVKQTSRPFAWDFSSIAIPIRLRFGLRCPLRPAYLTFTPRNGTNSRIMYVSSSWMDDCCYYLSPFKRSREESSGLRKEQSYAFSQDSQTRKWCRILKNPSDLNARSEPSLSLSTLL